MKKLLSTLLVTSFSLTAIGCGVQPMQAPNGRALAPNRGPAQLRTFNANESTQTNKSEKPIVDRKAQKNVPSTPFDQVGERTKGKTELPSDKAFTSPDAAQEPSTRARRGPFDDNPFTGNLPFRSFSDFYDYVRHSYSTTYEDSKYMSRRTAQHHFTNNRNAFRTVNRLYKPSTKQLKRFILVDTLANSLTVSGRALPYQNTHNPPSQAHYKYLPTQAAERMPTFGEIVDFNRSSYSVPYERWDMYRAARYYQANYARLMQMIMEYGPSKNEAWKLVHREITDYAGR